MLVLLNLFLVSYKDVNINWKLIKSIVLQQTAPGLNSDIKSNLKLPTFGAVAVDWWLSSTG